jgi:hypothetical protein
LSCRLLEYRATIELGTGSDTCSGNTNPPPGVHGYCRYAILPCSAVSKRKKRKKQKKQKKEAKEEENPKRENEPPRSNRHRWIARDQHECVSDSQIQRAPGTPIADATSHIQYQEVEGRARATSTLSILTDGRVRLAFRLIGLRPAGVGALGEHRVDRVET